jgi:hypothetical protein
MPKHRKSRKLMSRKIQKGGLWGLFEGSSDPNAPKKSWGDWWSGSTNSAENALTSGYNSVASGLSSTSSSIQNGLNADIDVNGSPQVSTNEYAETGSNPIGGRRRHRRHMRGGKGELGLTYYATPVVGSRTAEPTYWIKGGSKKGRTRKHYGRKSRRTHKRRR